MQKERRRKSLSVALPASGKLRDARYKGCAYVFTAESEKAEFWHSGALTMAKACRRTANQLDHRLQAC
jgi:hypothetical protein